MKTRKMFSPFPLENFGNKNQNETSIIFVILDKCITTKNESKKPKRHLIHPFFNIWDDPTHAIVEKKNVYISLANKSLKILLLRISSSEYYLSVYIL